jgi:hypothetical protein
MKNEIANSHTSEQMLGYFFLNSSYLKLTYFPASSKFLARTQNQVAQRAEHATIAHAPDIKEQ